MNTHVLINRQGLQTMRKPQFHNHTQQLFLFRQGMLMLQFIKRQNTQTSFHRVCLGKLA